MLQGAEPDWPISQCTVGSTTGNPPLPGRFGLHFNTLFSSIGPDHNPTWRLDRPHAHHLHALLSSLLYYYYSIHLLLVALDRREL